MRLLQPLQLQPLPYLPRQVKGRRHPMMTEAYHV
jgi:hypothetical protein